MKTLLIYYCVPVEFILCFFWMYNQMKHYGQEEFVRLAFEQNSVVVNGFKQLVEDNLALIVIIQTLLYIIIHTYPVNVNLVN